MPPRRARPRKIAPEPERLLQAKVPAELVKALRIRALQHETTVKALLTQLLRDYLKPQRSRAARTR